MPYKDLEKQKANARKNYKKNKDEINRKRRERYANDEEYRLKRKEMDKNYYDRVKSKSEYQKEAYKKNMNNEEYIRKMKIHQRIYRWKEKGIIFNDDKFIIHQKYIDCKNCELCGISFDNEKKCLEHDHLSRYNRFISCHSCNMKISSRDLKHMKVLLELHRKFNL